MGVLRWARPAAIDMDAMSDGELLGRVGKGDQVAFMALSRRHAPRALALVRNFARGLVDDDDIVQEALIRVWKMAPSWDPAGTAQFTTWFHRVVVNLCIDRARRPVHETIDDVPEPASGEVDAPTVIARQQTEGLVAAALQALPERQRAAIALCYYEEHTAAQAAEILGTTADAVESLLARARKALRQNLTRMGVRVD